jgi:sirohydrochlorin cobaltochelatase
MGGIWVRPDRISIHDHNRAMPETHGHALILFAHGARDTRWGQTLQALREVVLARRPSSRVDVAFLELQPPTLPQALAAAAAAGCKRIDIAPIFWASGGHLVNDVPPLLDEFRRANPEVQLNLLPVLSELPGMADFIASALDALAGNPQ